VAKHTWMVMFDVTSRSSGPMVQGQPLRVDHESVTGRQSCVYPDAEHGFDGLWSGWTKARVAASDARIRIRQFFSKHLR
jgi:hypothetical protein